MRSSWVVFWIRMARLSLVALAFVAVAGGCVHDGSGSSPVYDAVQRGDVGRLEELLEDGENPDDEPGAYVTPLGVAVSSGELRSAELLISYGADVNHPVSASTNWTYLHSAARRASVEMVDLLIDAGVDPCERVRVDAPRRTADPELPDARGMTALDVATSVGNDEAIPALRQATTSCKSAVLG